jgi:hypothetical protein
MKRSKQRVSNWLSEVWRIKEELSVEARQMGTRKYVAFLEKEGARIARTRVRPRRVFTTKDTKYTKGGTTD